MREVHYTSLAGLSFQTPLWQIVLHVVNHGTHHRGQVSGFLRRMGVVPPPLDLIAYYREQKTDRLNSNQTSQVFSPRGARQEDTALAKRSRLGGLRRSFARETAVELFQES